MTDPRGHHIEAPAASPTEPLRPWEVLAIDAVGNVIEFWGFKRNHGRLWGLLYVRDAAMTAAELQEVLGLSKGAVSMLTRELEQWRVLRRVRSPSDGTWRFTASTDFVSMVRYVLRTREGSFVSRVETDLAEAESLADGDGSALAEDVDRVRRMHRLARVVQAGLDSLIDTVLGSFGGAAEVLETPVGAEEEDSDD